MLNISLDMVPPSINERANIMRSNISKGGIPIDYDRLIEYWIHFQVEMGILGEKLIKATGIGSYIFSSSSFSTWVKKNNFTVGFNTTDTGNVSFNKDSLASFIATNAYGEEVTNIAKMYSTWNYYSSQVKFIPNILKAHMPTGLESADGRRVILFKPGVETQNTGRFGLVNPAPMNFPRYMKDLVVAPKGWRILSADSGQIEPKLIYGFYLPDKQIQKLIEIYGDAYYAVLHYCRMPEENIKNQVMDFTPFEITDSLKEIRQKLKTYGNGVMYGSTRNDDNDPIKEAYIERIGKHPLRVKWQNEVEEKILNGEHIFYTLFETPIDAFKSKKYLDAKSEREKQLALVHCAINNPIQGTAGDLMAFSLQASDNLISKKSPNSWITKFVHDEGQYCIYGPDFDYIAEELSQHTAYNIGGVVKIFNDVRIDRKISDVAPTSYATLVSGDSSGV